VKTSGLGNFALGQAVPNRDHAVCASLPTVDDLIGYEEKKPETLQAMRSGYPRFVEHPFLRKLIELEEKKVNPEGFHHFLFSNSSHCEEAIKRYSIQDYIVRERDEYTCLQIPSQSNATAQIDAFLQHTGGVISSRQAEDILLKKGHLLKRENISSHENPFEFAQEIIAEVHGSGVTKDGVLFASSGANAFYSLFQTAYLHSLQKGKNLWIRLGWLYLDTNETMNLLANDDEIITLTDPTDLDELRKVFKQFGGKIAGLVTEFPTNPLLQSCDLEQVRELCDQVDAMLIIDPTMASPKNSKVAELGDVLVNSLTKYASWEGDVMIGSLVFPDHSKMGQELFNATAKTISPPFERDLLRLCEQLPLYPSFVEKTNHSLVQVVDFLESSNFVKKVFWAYQENSAKNFTQRAGDGKPGCVVSFEVKGDFERFYNQLSMLKSPSFGTEFSLCCPYVYLAHYNLIKSKKGQNSLNKAGISPQLCRLSVGLENPNEIIKTLQISLQGMNK
jgi:cystathionine gamma-synthase